MIDSIKRILYSHFMLKDLGSVKYFLGLELSRSKDEISLSQGKYCLQILEDMGFLGANFTAFTIESNLKLSMSYSSLLFLDDAITYRRLIGRLLYLQIS